MTLANSSGSIASSLVDPTILRMCSTSTSRTSNQSPNVLSGVENNGTLSPSLLFLSTSSADLLLSSMRADSFSAADAASSSSSANIEDGGSSGRDDVVVEGAGGAREGVT